MLYDGISTPQLIIRYACFCPYSSRGFLPSHKVRMSSGHELESNLTGKLMCGSMQHYFMWGFCLQEDEDLGSWGRN